MIYIYIYIYSAFVGMANKLKNKVSPLFPKYSVPMAWFKWHPFCSKILTASIFKSSNMNRIHFTKTQSHSLCSKTCVWLVLPEYEVTCSYFWVYFANSFKKNRGRKFTLYRGLLYCHALKIHQFRCSKSVICEVLKRKV